MGITCTTVISVQTEMGNIYFTPWWYLFLTRKINIVSQFWKKGFFCIFCHEKIFQNSLLTFFLFSFTLFYQAFLGPQNVEFSCQMIRSSLMLIDEIVLIIFNIRRHDTFRRSSNPYPGTENNLSHRSRVGKTNLQGMYWKAFVNPSILYIWRNASALTGLSREQSSHIEDIWVQLHHTGIV